MKEKDKRYIKPQFSKILVFVSGAIFVLAVIWCLFGNVASLYDTSLQVTIITVCGGIFGSAIIWYEKKAQAENVSKIKLQHVKEISQLEFDTYEKKLRLQQELGILGSSTETDDGCDFHVDEMYDDAVNSDNMYVDSKMDDATTDPDIQNY